MIRALLRRLTWAVFVLWVVMSGVFLLVNVIGDPAVAALGEKAGPDQLAAFREKYGLDRPLPAQYVTFVGNMARLDFGRSYQDDQPVLEVLGRRLPRTLLLGAMALVFELGIGLSLGIVAAYNRHRWFDSLAMALAFLGISMPSFVVGLFMLSTLALRYGFFPVGGYGVDFWNHVHHGVLPALALAVTGAATYARISRAETIEILSSDFVRTARAKGLSPLRIAWAHVLRNSLLPIVTLMGMSMRILVSGAILTETVFAWPGMGRLAVEAITGLDLPIVMAVVFVGCAVVQVGNLIADLAVYALDPRTRGP